jgi:hypothetical protein
MVMGDHGGINHENMGGLLLLYENGGLLFYLIGSYEMLPGCS